MNRIGRGIAGLIGAGLFWTALFPAQALEKFEAGSVGQPSALVWPYYVAQDKGFFAAEGIALDITYTNSSSSAIQQLVAGSLDVVISAGIVEPIHAAARGAPVAILRIIGQVPPYAILAQPSIHKISELKGKTVAIAGLSDIARLYFDRMFEPNGVHWGDYDAINIPQTTGRYAALRSGAIAATLLGPPLSFDAEHAGYNNLGMTVDYARDLPFTASVVSRPWAAKHAAFAHGINRAFAKGLVWLNDPANRSEAIDILVKGKALKQREVEDSYALLQRIAFFAPDAKVSRKVLDHLIEAMTGIGDMDGKVDSEKLVVSGLTELTD